MKQLYKNSYHRLPILDGLEILDAKRHTLNFPFHTHDTFNITLVIDQTFSTKFADSFLQAPAGTIVITNPHEVHSTICDTKIGSSFFTFYVSPDVLAELNNRRPVFFENKVIGDPALFRELYIISRAVDTSGNGIENNLENALQKLVKRHSAGAVTSTKRNRLFQQFLEEEIVEKFSLENAAGKFGLDKFKFLRLFKSETGLTPNNYIILKRIEKCKQLLQTQNDLLDIAIETGFYDATHLCKYFKKITGVTPLEYRNA